MTTTTELEDRLRRGLQDAGDALPDALAPRRWPPAGPPHRPGGHRRTHRLAGLAAAAVVTAATVAVAAVVTADGDDGSPPAVRSAAETTAPPTSAPHVPRVTNGMVPGQAVVLDAELRTYGPDGAQTGTVDLSRFSNIGSASSDLDGGWVICGSHTLTPEEQEEHLADLAEEFGGPVPEGASVPYLDELVWFPADGEPEVLNDPGSTMCAASSVRVVDSPQGPTLVYQRMGGGPALLAWEAVVLATGEQRDLPVPDTGELLRWSVTSDRFLTAGPDGFHLYDLATGEELPMAAIEAADPSDVVLTGDGTSVAALTGSAVGPSEVTVWDTATGAERFREQLSIPLEGAELSFEGTTLAFGNYYEGNGPVTVVDLATGERHEIDAHGILP